MKTFSMIVPRGLIVSCQAPRGDPLHGSAFMARMAVAAALGGAVAIRADGREDIQAIRQSIQLPIIGINKNYYPSSPVYITPTFDEAAEAFQAGADVLALDGTERPRPRGEDLGRLIERIHTECAIPVMADVSSLEEGLRAASLGADALASTLSGYIEGSPKISEPDLQLVKSLAAAVDIPIVAEGRYQSPREAAAAIEAGAYAVVVGSAITRPHLITESFSAAVRKQLA
jgi:N-acylglucosamine-6-phosphate 2-epimerase